MIFQLHPFSPALPPPVSNHSAVLQARSSTTVTMSGRHVSYLCNVFASMIIPISRSVVSVKIHNLNVHNPGLWYFQDIVLPKGRGWPGLVNQQHLGLQQNGQKGQEGWVIRTQGKHLLTAFLSEFLTPRNVFMFSYMMWYEKKMKIGKPHTQNSGQLAPLNIVILWYLQKIRSRNPCGYQNMWVL